MRADRRSDYKQRSIFWLHFPEETSSCVQAGNRPAIIVSNDKNNEHSSTVNVVPLTTSTNKKNLPTHVKLEGCGLKRTSTVLAEQVTTIDKRDLGEHIGYLEDEEDFTKLKRALIVQFNLTL